MSERRPELILPAGSLEKLKFACAYGADAVYAGMPRLSLRARAGNFTAPQLAEGIQYAHERGVKVYLTLNIFARNQRLQPSLEALKAVMPLDPDAVIMSDPGLIMLVRREFPDLELHLSTQTNTMNWAAVRFWHTQGVKRVILPRELSIPEIRDIHAEVPAIELEAFVHGAMCISYSGRCLLSGYLTHRDANLGACANSCRWQYRVWQDTSAYALEEVTRPGEFFPIDEDEHGTYILNSRDLCAVEHLQALRDAGVTGFKVEGRTKSVYYLAHTGRAYRRALDDLAAGRPLDPSVLTDIHATSTRGFIPGFLIPLPDAARQNYELGRTEYSSYQFAGVAHHYDPDRHLVQIEVKNRIIVGDCVEFVTPGESFSQTIQAMYTLNHAPITEAHGGAQPILLAVERAIEPFTLLRKAL